MYLSDFAKRFSEETGQKIQIDSDNHLAFTVDDCVIHILEQADLDVLIIYSEPLKPRVAPGFKTLQALLQMNYMYKGTQGATVAMSPETNDLVLHYRILNSSMVDLDAFLEDLERFTQAYLNIQDFLNGIQSDDF